MTMLWLLLLDLIMMSFHAWSGGPRPVSRCKMSGRGAPRNLALACGLLNRRGGSVTLMKLRSGAHWSFGPAGLRGLGAVKMPLVGANTPIEPERCARPIWTADLDGRSG